MAGTGKFEKLRRRARTIWVPVRGYWSGHPLVDWCFVAVAIIVEGLFVVLGGHRELLESLDLARRTTLYQLLATVSALLFGFATATIAFFYSSLGGRRASILTAVRGEELVGSWRAVVTAPLVIVITCLALIALDHTTADHFGAVWIVQAAVLLLVARIVRLRWLFIELIKLVTKDNQDSASRACPVSHRSQSTMAAMVISAR